MIYSEYIAKKIDERRSTERTKIVLPVQVGYSEQRSPQRKNPELIGKTANMSQTGACLILNGPVPIASEIKLHVDLPPNYRHLLENEKIHRIKAHVIWITPTSGMVHHYRCGINFFDPENKYPSVINMIVSVEIDQLLERAWDTSHHTSIFSTLPFSSPLLDDLRPSALSVDVTNVCNLRCKHCFWDSYEEELLVGTNEDILDSVWEVLKKFPTITNITWYGGEPLISDKTIALVQQGMKFKKNNLVITNGTFPMPEWRENIHFAVSLDGTQAIHDSLRGVDTYNKIKKNVLFMLAKKVPIAILYCVNTANIECIPDFLNEWADKNAIGIVFTAYAPLRGRDSYLSLGDNQRDRAVSLLLKMKKKYGRFIGNTETMIELIRGKYGEEMAQDCPMNILNRGGRGGCSLHMCNDGSIRVPCALGRDADCLQCRSVTKIALYAGLVLRDKRSLLAAFRMYHSKPYGEQASALTTELIQ
jgi:sulfatase maturation enzyme AslB (radical SAM superfamily)